MTKAGFIRFIRPIRGQAVCGGSAWAKADPTDPWEYIILSCKHREKSSETAASSAESRLFRVLHSACLLVITSLLDGGIAGNVPVKLAMIGMVDVSDSD